MAGHGPLSESSRSEAEGPSPPAPWRRDGWAQAASGAGGVRQGAVPLGIGSQQDVQHGFFPSAEHFAVPFRVLWSAGGEAGRPVVSALGMVHGQFRFGHRSPWMAAATMAARLHSSSTASAHIAVSMARPSPIHHSM